MERNMRIEEELFPFYALDALTEEERHEVEVYVAANPDAEVRLAKMTAAAAEFGQVVQPITPSVAVKTSLMARVEADFRATEQPAAVAARPPQTGTATQRQPAAEPRVPWWQRLFTPAVAAFATIALILSAVAVWQLLGQVETLEQRVAVLEEGAGDLQTQVNALEEENRTLRQELSVRDDLLAQYTAPGAVTVSIGDVTGENPAAVGTLTLNPDSGEATLRVANLPPLDPGSTYQAWVIAGETPISAGTFTVDDNGAGSHVLSGEIPPQFDAIGVSQEPAGGSESPTPGNIILLGESF